MQSCYVKLRMFITIFTYENAAATNGALAPHTQPGGRSDCMCVQVYRWDCLHVCCSQTGALAHIHNQVASLIACVCKYTAGYSDCSCICNSCHGRQLPTEQQPPSAPQPTLVNRPVMSPVAVLWPHLRGRKMLISAGKQDAGMHIALSCMHHISCICRLPAGKSANM